jgi:radical SAM protein with 4Fe4S-binding SPASM domain
MNTTYKQTRGLSVFTSDEKYTLILPDLNEVTLSETEYNMWKTVGEGKSIEELHRETKIDHSHMTKEDVTGILDRLASLSLVHPVASSPGEKAFPFEERLFDREEKNKVTLVRKNLIGKDTSLHYVYFTLHSGSTFQKPSLYRSVEEILPQISRSAIIFFRNADMYLDSQDMIDVTKFIIERIPYDRPILVFESDPSIIEESMLLPLSDSVKSTHYQCADLATLMKRTYGEKAITIGSIRCFTNDDNLFLLLKIDKSEDVKEISYLRKYFPTIRFGLSMKVRNKNQIEDIETILKITKSPVFLQFENNSLIPDYFKYFLRYSKVLFMDDDLFRMKEALLKNYLPLLDCGAGRRKLTISGDGLVYPCPPAVKEGYVLGHIDDGINHILQGKKAQTLRKMISDKFNSCSQKCCLAYYCGGCFLESRCSYKIDILKKIIGG